MPPHKMRAVLAELQKADPASEEHQKYQWELLRKSINGIVNKVSVSNISHIVLELFNENLLRGRGLVAKALMKAQMASVGHSHVFVALLSALNTKLPDVVRLLVHRIIHAFQKAYRRKQKIQCRATTTFIAHLVNQQIVHELIALQMLALFLEKPTEDSVELACEFATQCGQMLSETTPAGMNAIFERFRAILHEGQIDRRVQYCIEQLFEVRKQRFAAYPGVIPELDLVEEKDKITHNVSLDDEFNPDENCNFFRFDPQFQQNEEMWEEIKKEILGEYYGSNLAVQAGIVPNPDGDSDSGESSDLQAATKIDTNNVSGTS